MRGFSFNTIFVALAVHPSERQKRLQPVPTVAEISGFAGTGRRVWSTTPHRRLHLGDLGPLVLQIVLFFFLAYYVYDFGQYVCDVLTD